MRIEGPISGLVTHTRPQQPKKPLPLPLLLLLKAPQPLPRRQPQSPKPQQRKTSRWKCRILDPSKLSASRLSKCAKKSFPIVMTDPPLTTLSAVLPNLSSGALSGLVANICWAGLAGCLKPKLNKMSLTIQSSSSLHWTILAIRLRFKTWDNSKITKCNAKNNDHG